MFSLDTVECPCLPVPGSGEEWGAWEPRLAGPLSGKGEEWLGEGCHGQGQGQGGECLGSLALRLSPQRGAAQCRPLRGGRGLAGTCPLSLRVWPGGPSLVPPVLPSGPAGMRRRAFCCPIWHGLSFRRGHTLGRGLAESSQPSSPLRQWPAASPPRKRSPGWSWQTAVEGSTKRACGCECHPSVLSRLSLAGREAGGGHPGLSETVTATATRRSCGCFPGSPGVPGAEGCLRAAPLKQQHFYPVL